MPTRFSCGVAALLVGAVVFVAAPVAQAAQAADDYPRKPVRLIVPTAPGGPVDIVARIVVPGLAAELGQPFVIDNRAGAGGIVGAEMVARALPDGYTLLMTHSGLLGLAPMMFTPQPYDSIRDFAPVSVAAAMPMLLLAHPGLAAKSVPELVALAKSQPGKLNFASGGTGTGIHVAFELFNMTTGIKITHVPYKGAAPGMTGVMAGEADLMFNGLPSALPLLALADEGAALPPPPPPRAPDPLVEPPLRAGVSAPRPREACALVSLGFRPGRSVPQPGAASAPDFSNTSRTCAGVSEELKSMRFPSGDQRGRAAPVSALVSGAASPPSSGNR